MDADVITIGGGLAGLVAALVLPYAPPDPEPGTKTQLSAAQMSVLVP